MVKQYTSKLPVTVPAGAADRAAAARGQFRTAAP